MKSVLLLEPVARFSHLRFRAKSELPKWLSGFLPELPGRNLAVTVLYVPSFLDGGMLQNVPEEWDASGSSKGNDLASGQLQGYVAR